MRFGKLRALDVERAKEGRYGDGGGLTLVVSASGQKRWELRFRFSGRRRDMGLGRYPEATLAEARERAADARKLLARGIDPIEARKTERQARRAVPTFAEVAGPVIAAAQARSRNAKVRYQYGWYLGPAYCGQILNRPVNEITTTELAKLLRPIWTTKPEVARKLLPLIRRVFDHARVVLRDEHGIIVTENPANREDLKRLGFDAPKALSRGKHPHLAYSELPAFMQALRARNTVAARALELLVLTNVRTGSLLAAEWSEFDLENAVWSIPVEHLKDGHHRNEPFRVPLSPRAVEILREMAAAKTGPYVFPGQKAGQHLSQMALVVFLRKMNVDSAGRPIWLDPVQRRPVVPHGFRATFRTWAEEYTGSAHATIEECMGHQVATQVERAYRRTDILAKRRELMEQWAGFCGGADLNVP